MPKHTTTILITLLSLIAWLTACASDSTGRPAAIQPPLSTPTAVAQLEQPDETPVPAAGAGAPDSAQAETPETASRIPTPTPSPMPGPDPTTLALALMPFADGFDSPIFLTHAGDASGRLFVVEKAGLIHIWRDGQRIAEPFLDLTAQVNDGGNEQGLLGLAFDPDFATNGYFYVNYTAADDATVVARYAVEASSPDRADPDSAFEILRVEQPARNHNAGMLAFGPDGYLYVGMGDGGGANDRYENGQNPDSLLGKMLRLDVTGDRTAPYTIPADNPWRMADWNGADVRDEIWAVGLRNPWRYSFDRATGDLWLTDVGQNLFEEVNRVPAGATGGLNFGWPIMEGRQCFPDDDTCDRTGLTLPVTDYRHEDGNCSITGGYVYRGNEFPQIQGVYFFADYCSGAMWALSETAPGEWQQAQVLDAEGRISSFGEDEDGELYLLDLDGGTISRIVITDAP